jgi:arylsulfatase A-like enzyme
MPGQGTGLHQVFDFETVCFMSTLKKAKRAFQCLLVGCALLACRIVPAVQPAPGSAKPNFLVIVADDLGFADVGFNGGKISTPNLDRLAASGVKLTDFRACPMCSPTRAGLLTGRWPIRYGLMRSVVPPWSTNGLPATERTLAELLGAAGYEQRGIIGKWHLGHARKEFLPLAQGFTRFYGHYNGAIDYFTHEREGETDWHEGDRSLKQEEYSTDLLADAAADFVAKAPQGKPWLLYLPFNAPHAPFQAKQSDLAKYPQLKMPDRRAYAAMVDSLDQAVGRVLGALEQRADATNTLVLFFSDNGGVPRVGSNAPWRGGKLSVYEGGTRVCAVIRWPAGGLIGGRQFAERIGYIDVLPTLLAAAGMGIPEKIDGVNVLPALRGEKPLSSRRWFSYIHQGEDAHASVHDGKWKLVAKGDFFSETPSVPPRLELYDLEKDPGETNDVARANSETVKKLHQGLVEFGKFRTSEGEDYAAGRADFRAPKDWIITE